MKFLKIFMVVAVVVIAVFFVGGLFLPKSYSVSRSINISAPDTVIYTNIANFKNFLTWSPWSKIEPTAKRIISGTPALPGHIYRWEGNKTGVGQMEITATKPTCTVKMLVTLSKPFETSANTQFNLKKERDYTKVTWSIHGENHLFGKWLAVFISMDTIVGEDFENGLKSLKEKLEKHKRQL
jgi:hypothetical protein